MQSSTQSMWLIARLLACYDPRLSEERSRLAEQAGYSQKHVESVLRELRRGVRELWAQHIRDIRALGLASIVVSTRRQLEDVRTVDDLERVGLPWARYLYSYRRVLSDSGRRVYSYLAPIDMLDEMVDDIGGFFDDAKIDIGFNVPVVFTCDNLDPVDVVDDEALERARRMLGTPPPKERIGLLEVLLYARLDENPLATYRDMQNISTVLEERIGRAPPLRLKFRKVVLAHERLSRKRLLGRVLVLRAVWGDETPAPLYVSVRASCAAHLYALASSLWASPSIFVGKETAATVLVIPDSRVHVIEETLGDCITESGYITAGFGTVIPVEMYSPKRGWTTEKQPIEKLLLGLGLAEKHEQDTKRGRTD